MRKGFLGSIAAVAAGAGAAWAQPPAPAGDPPPPAAIAPAGDVIPVNGPGVPNLGIVRPVPPAPVIMPPLAVGPAGDPQGLGPVAGFGPPPGPMYPNPGPYGAPMFQPPPPGAGAGAGTGGGMPAPHWWLSGDYLMYFSKAQPVRFPLLTTSAPSDQGLLGRPSTLVLAGNKDIPYGTLSGFRVTGGFYADADRRYGFEATGWLIAEKSVTTDIQSSPTGIPTLARPFIDSTNVRAATSLVLANPNFGSGRVVVDNTTQVYSLEANGLVNLYRSGPDCGKKCAWSLDFLAGYRYLELQEDLSVESNTTLNLPSTTTPIFAVGPFGILTQVGTTVTPGVLPVAGITARTPALITVRDDFRVTNRFNGGQVGMRAEARHGMFTFAATGKLALGNMHQRLEINGTTGVIDATRNQLGGALGGLLANASNIGRYNHDEFAVIPEVNLNLGLNVTRGLTTFIGYNFLYIDNVARPGSQINPIVNTATVPLSPNYGATNRPAVVNQLFNQDEYWLMGVNFGFMLRY